MPTPLKSPAMQASEARSQKAADAIKLALPALAANASEVMALCTSMIPTPEIPGLAQIASSMQESACGTLSATIALAHQLSDGSGTNPMTSDAVTGLCRLARVGMKLGSVKANMASVMVVIGLVAAAAPIVSALPLPIPPLMTPPAALATAALPQVIQASALTPSVFAFAFSAALSALTVCLAEASLALEPTPSESLDQMRSKREYDRHGKSSTYHGVEAPVAVPSSEP